MTEIEDGLLNNDQPIKDKLEILAIASYQYALEKMHNNLNAQRNGRHSFDAEEIYKLINDLFVETGDRDRLFSAVCRRIQKGEKE